MSGRLAEQEAWHTYQPKQLGASGVSFDDLFFPEKHPFHPTVQFVGRDTVISQLYFESSDGWCSITSIAWDVGLDLSEP